MGFTLQDYPFTSKSGIVTQVHHRTHYERLFLDSLKAGHQLFMCNIFSDQYLKIWSSSNSQSQLDLDQCYIISDMSFTSLQFQHISPLINVLAFDYLTQQRLNQYIKFVIEYCGYLGIKCLSIPFLSSKINCLSKILNKLQEHLYKAKLGVILHIKLSKETQWEEYFSFIKQVDKRVHIDLIVQFTSTLPQKNTIKKWMSDKIAFFSFSSQCFVMNNSGHAVLPLAYENLTKQFFKLRSGYVFSMKLNQSQNQEFKPINYFKYVNHLFQIMVKNSTKRQIQARGLHQILQHPLQPYADNLQSHTYSIFQFDAPKYQQYSVAILLAFQKINVTNRNIVVYYLGAGRGALIPGIIQASKKTKKKVTIYAIQKNPFPIQSLKRRIKQNKWSNIVKIVKTDIKQYKFEEQPDIFFSELLGGFGDNELSPQCLKWAEDKIHNKKNLICIPQKYSAFIKPVCYPFIHRNLTEHEKEGYFTVNFGWHYSPFKSKKVWQFCHPLPENNQQAFNRKSIQHFVAGENISIHGLLGSFDCNLYDSSYFSIVPESQTIDMYSWFPIYFAFKEEEYLQKDEKIEITMERINSQKKVWYEWSYRIFDKEGKMLKQSKVHNKNGCQKCIYL